MPCAYCVLQAVNDSECISQESPIFKRPHSHPHCCRNWVTSICASFVITQARAYSCHRVMIHHRRGVPVLRKEPSRQSLAKNLAFKVAPFLNSLSLLYSSKAFSSVVPSHSNLQSCLLLLTEAHHPRSREWDDLAAIVPVGNDLCYWLYPYFSMTYFKTLSRLHHEVDIISGMNTRQD